MKTFAQASILVLLMAVCLGSQGVVSRGVKPMPRGEPSGLPFHAKFTDVAGEAGLNMPVIYGEVDYKDYILETVGSGAAFFDYDNDGWIDIFLLSGTRRKNAPPGAINRLYRNNRDGAFRDVTADSGLGRSGWASSVTVGDYDNDGDIDMLIVNLNQPPSLLRNDLDTEDHWLKVKLIGVASNRSAIGSSVKIRYADRQQVQAVLAQDSFYSVSDRRLHFGLGEVDRVDLEVCWPQGSTETLKDLAVDRLVTVREGEGIVSSDKMP